MTTLEAFEARYQHLSELSPGIFGIVNLYLDNDTDRYVVIKLVDDLHEIDILYALQNLSSFTPCIQKILDSYHLINLDSPNYAIVSPMYGDTFDKYSFSSSENAAIFF